MTNCIVILKKNYNKIKLSFIIINEYCKNLHLELHAYCKSLVLLTTDDNIIVL